MTDALLSDTKQAELYDFIRERINNFKNSGKAISDLVVNAIVNEIAMKEFDEVFGSIKPEVIEISNLSEVPQVVKTMME